MPAFVVAHYDPQGRLDTHLYELVRALPGPVVFVSTGLSEAEAKRLGEHARVVTRPNVGYDFFSYRTGIELLGDSLPQQDGLVILNSSFVTVDPRRLLDRYFAQFSADTHMLGITRSHQREPHIQSYWVGFGPPVLRSPAFLEWWNSVQPISDKTQVVRTYELGMTRFFHEHGFATDAAYQPSREQRLRATLRMIDCPRIKVDTGETLYAMLAKQIDPSGWLGINVDAVLPALNPTHMMWDFLLDEFGIIKADLVKRNPLDLNLTTLPTVCTPRQLELVRETLR
jgi:rhamnosyltransferase